MKLLHKGDKVAIISPSACIEKNSLNKGVAWLESKGLEVVLMPHVYDSNLYMAGTDNKRADDVNNAFADNSIKAIFCSRGGAGATKILDFLDFEMIRKNKKPVFGLSDSTALQNALFQKSEIISYTGFLPVYDFKNNVLDAKIEKSMQSIFDGLEQKLHSGKKIIGGKTEGILVGGNLSVLCYLCGTPYFPDLENKILLLEDIGEKTYKTDLMLNQLKQQKNFNKLKGMVFGTFTECVESDTKDGSVEDIIVHFAKQLSVPSIYNFEYGHKVSRYVLPIGAHVALDTDNLVLNISGL